MGMLQLYNFDHAFRKKNPLCIVRSKFIVFTIFEKGFNSLVYKDLNKARKSYTSACI